MTQAKERRQARLRRACGGRLLLSFYKMSRPSKKQQRQALSVAESDLTEPAANTTLPARNLAHAFRTQLPAILLN